MLDYHLHLWPHGQRETGPTLEQVAAYCSRAQEAGVSEIALTEHLFRFAQADQLLKGFWKEDPSPLLRGSMEAYWSEHAHADLDTYVDVVLEAKAAGLPVVLGLEVDYYPGRMGDVGQMLAGYPFDVLLGSVHWIGAWGFDRVDDRISMAEWDHRSVEATWDAYTQAIEELAQSGTCDVLAHPDLVKVTGKRPSLTDEFYDRMAEATAGSGMAAEVSSAGWRKPVAEAYPAPELLVRFCKKGVAITTASDAHHLGDVAYRVDELRSIVERAGYKSLCSFQARNPTSVELAPTPTGSAGGVRR